MSYEGRVAVNGASFNGTGLFKFALVNPTGTTSYWSNDGTSSAGGQPTNSVSLAVANGFFSVQLGDTTLTNMTALPASAFNHADVRLRVWFSNGTPLGWQQLTPDQRIGTAGYAMMAADVADGAITSSKIASGAVGATQLAAGAVGATQLGTNAIQSSNISAGAVGNIQLANAAVSAQKLSLTGGVGPVVALNVADGAVTSAGFADGAVGSAKIADGSVTWQKLAKPPLAGIVDGFGLAPGSTVPFSVNFGRSYATPPTVVACFASPYPAALAGATVAVNTVTTAQFTGTVSISSVNQVLAASPSSYSPVCLAVVNGNPAVCYWETTSGVSKLWFKRASDSNGTLWADSVLVKSASSRWDITMAVVQGNPAIAWCDGYSIYFVRATQPDGSAWGSIINAVSESGKYLSMAVINGNPAISYFTGDYLHMVQGDLKYARSSTADGSGGWGVVTVDDQGDNIVGEYPSLAQVNGKPAICYYAYSNGNLKYAQAADASGSSWNTPIVVDTGYRGRYPSLAVINGKPAVSYVISWTEIEPRQSKVLYRSAQDADGINWNPYQVIDICAYLSSGPDLEFRDTSLIEINNRPVVAYYKYRSSYHVDLGPPGLNIWIGAGDSYPNNGRFMIDLPDTDSGNKESIPLAMVNGNPGVAYIVPDGLSFDVRFVRPVMNYDLQWMAYPP